VAIFILAAVGTVAGILLWVLETNPVEPHGLDSFDVPPPIPYDGPWTEFE
jgi:hypothetical protein